MPHPQVTTQSQTQNGAHRPVLQKLTQRKAKVLLAGITQSVMFGVPSLTGTFSSSEGVRVWWPVAFGRLGSGPRHDPAVEAITGPLCQYAAEWWRATDACSSLGTPLSPGFLVNSLPPAKAGTFGDGRCHQQARVPLSAMLCSLDHKRWELTNTTSLVTNDGSAISLCCFCRPRR